MPEAGEYVALGLEARAARPGIRAHQLDRDLLLEAARDAFGAPNLAHAAGTEATHQPIWPECGSGVGRLARRVGVRPSAQRGPIEKPIAALGIGNEPCETQVQFWILDGQAREKTGPLAGPESQSLIEPLVDDSLALQIGHGHLASHPVGAGQPEHPALCRREDVGKRCHTACVEATGNGAATVTAQRFATSALAALIALVSAPAAMAATFTVTTNADSGAGSLRQAIEAANSIQVENGTACITHTIQFAIPGNAPHTIRPLSPLPVVRIPIIMDAFTQPGASANTLVLGSNMVPGIELDGSMAGATDAIVIGGLVPGAGTGCGGSGTRISGFVINRFAGSAISAGADGCLPGQGCSTGGLIIRGNFIGTDVTGTIALGNGAGLSRPAIRFGSLSSVNIVGDQIVSDGGPNTPSPAARNVISGNAGDAISISAVTANIAAAGNRIRNNYIGVDATGTVMMPNGGRGIVSGPHSTNAVFADNVIAGNVGDGVFVTDNAFGPVMSFNAIGVGIGNRAFGNGGHGVYLRDAPAVGVSGRAYFIVQGDPSIANNAGAGVFIDTNVTADVTGPGFANNAGLGIDIAPLGVNPNDTLDADSGPNELLNTPTITSASYDPMTLLTAVEGNVHSVPMSEVEVYFFGSPSCDPSGSGEGQRPLTNPTLFARVRLDAAGNGAFSVNVSGVTPGQSLTTIARRFNTVPFTPAIQVSEFSPCASVVSTSPFIFGDSFE
jgi:hypothetical protein